MPGRNRAGGTPSGLPPAAVRDRHRLYDMRDTIRRGSAKLPLQLAVFRKISFPPHSKQLAGPGLLCYNTSDEGVFARDRESCSNAFSIFRISEAMETMNRKIRVLAVILLLLFLAGCGGSEAVWSPLTGEGHIRIAVLGDDDFYLEGGTTEAMELAAEDFRQETGLPIDLVYCDDDADYHKAIAWAKSLAADPEITAVISKQEIDFIDTVADMLEDAKKPYVVLSGCYNHTIEHGYDYLLADFIHARAAGKIMGRYVTSRGFRRAAFCHSDTEYEEDELKGFQDQVSGTDTEEVLPNLAMVDGIFAGSSFIFLAMYELMKLLA